MPTRFNASLRASKASMSTLLKQSYSLTGSSILFFLKEIKKLQNFWPLNGWFFSACGLFFTFQNFTSALWGLPLFRGRSVFRGMNIGMIVQQSLFPPLSSFRLFFQCLLFQYFTNYERFEEDTKTFLQTSCSHSFFAAWDFPSLGSYREWWPKHQHANLRAPGHFTYCC